MRRRFMNNTQLYDYSNYMTIEAIEDVSVLFNLYVMHSTDGVEWTTSKEVKAKPNQFVSIKRTAISGEKLTGTWSGGSFNLRGNCMSLIYGDNAEGETSMNGFSLSGLFKESNVVAVERDFLPATILSKDCYREMFSSCTSLVQAPDLPATTLADGCYSWMFNKCTSLVQAPDIPATTLAAGCYNYMFDECTSLTSAPALPATTLADRCYSWMFNKCTSLVQAPDLPATTLADGCYANMFTRCTSLVQAPDLPATTLEVECYKRMFYDCTSLGNAPALPATTLIASCYEDMFYGCTNLNHIKMLATDISALDCLSQWVLGVSSTGTFVKNKDATWNTTPGALGTSGVPAGWTVVDDEEEGKL